MSSPTVHRVIAEDTYKSHFAVVSIHSPNSVFFLHDKESIYILSGCVHPGSQHRASEFREYFISIFPQSKTSVRIRK